LKSFVANPDEWQLSEEGDAPLGPTRMLLSKPVIAAVSGYAVAGGLELALWCDLRVVEQSATFGVFCRRWGVPLIDGGTIRLSRLIGHSRALDLILTGRPVGTARAAAEALAAQIAAFPQTCMRQDRLSSYEQWGLPLQEALRNECRHGRISLDSGDARSGADKFREGEGRHGRFEK
jgi:enoyl-CoA hydratase